MQPDSILRENGIVNAMRTTIDSAGRLVIPKAVRQQARLEPGMPLEIRVREGHIEIEPVPVDVDIRPRGRLVVAVPRTAVPPLNSETVEATRRRLRKDRVSE